MMHIDQALANHDGESSAGVVEKVVCVSAASIEQGGMLSGRTRCGVWAESRVTGPMPGLFWLLAGDAWYTGTLVATIFAIF